MGAHDRDNTKDGYWPKPVPKGDVRDKPKDDSSKHSNRPDPPNPDDKDQEKK